MTTAQVLQFKSNVESIQPSDVSNLQSVKANKSMAQHLERVKAGRFEKNEINALCKLFASKRFATDKRKTQINALEALILKCEGSQYEHSDFQIEIMHFRKPMKISKEQTQQGKAYLKDHYFKKTGERRSGKNTEFVSDSVLSIAKSVSRFEFVGLAFVTNPYGMLNQVLPIYRTFNSRGESYDYSPIHWGQPVIITGHIA